MAAVVERKVPLQPGEAAPDFTLSALHREGEVSLGEYRGRSAVLVTLYRGLYCPFCRRHIAQLGTTREKLQEVGAETLGIVATTPERARLYLQYHPAPAPLAADPELATHRAFGVRQMKMTPLTLVRFLTTRINPTGELAKPLSPIAVPKALNVQDGYELTETDQQDIKRQGTQLVGQFLLDRNGIVRWRNIECAEDGPAGFGKFPSHEELLAAARTLT